MSVVTSKLKLEIVHSEKLCLVCCAEDNYLEPRGRGTSDAASLRRETVHEALFMGEPLGFAIHGMGINQDVTHAKCWRWSAGLW